jgi:mRNA interferase MazF
MGAAQRFDDRGTGERRWLLSYCTRSQPRRAGRAPIHAFSADRDRSASPERMAAWRQETVSRFQQTILAGEHFFIENALPDARRCRRDRPGPGRTVGVPALGTGGLPFFADTVDLLCGPNACLRSSAAYLGGHVERGEVWWAEVDEKRPIVLLSGGDGPEFRAMQIVAPATPAEKRGFVVMSGREAIDPEERQRITDSAGSAAGAIGVEVAIGAEEGLPHEGVVRVALPKEGKIFCTWMLTLSKDYLIERVGVLSPEKLRELDNAVALAAID